MDMTRYVNRELSLLDFQERVLSLAEAEDRPLLERVKFVAIVSANLDEFSQVRVAGLLEQATSGVTTTSPDGMTPTEQLAAIRERVTELNGRIDALVNSAGVVRRATVLETSESDWDRVMDVNVKGVFIGAQCAIPAMRGSSSSASSSLTLATAASSRKATMTAVQTASKLPRSSE